MESKDRIPILEILDQYGVSYKRVGEIYMTHCLFHRDKDASMAIYPETDSFYCFGCGTWGTAVNIVMLKEGLNYYEAAEKLYGKDFALRKLKEPTKDFQDTDTTYSLKIISDQIRKRDITDPAKLTKTIMRIATLEKIGPDNLFALLKEVKQL